MKTTSRKIRMTVTMLTILLLTACSGGPSNIIVAESGFIRTLWPAVTNAVVQYTVGNLKTSATEKFTINKRKETKPMEKKESLQTKSKSSLFSFGTTEAHLVSSDNEKGGPTQAGS